MVGWIFLILVAILMLFTADTVVYLVTWLVAYLNAALSAVGIRIEAFDYLDIMYPYFRSAVQATAVGVIAVAVLHIAVSIKEEA